MLRSIARRFAGPVIERMIIRAARAKGELPQPGGDPRVHAMGPDPDRILVLGAGAVRGLGVASHDLGIGGQLARQLSALTGRGADIELLGVPGLTAPVALGILDDVDLARFDALVVMLGNREAIGLRPAAAWERDIRALIDLALRTAPALSVFVVGLAPPPSTVPLSRLLGPIISRQITRLNDATRHASTEGGVFFIPFSPDERELGEIGSTSTYLAWAQQIAAGMHSALDAAQPAPRGEADETVRQAAFDAMNLIGWEPSAGLVTLVRSTKDLFGVEGAAVNLVDAERLYIVTAAGRVPDDIPWSESFSAFAVRLGGAFVVEDTQRDGRVRSLEAARHLRFYAGYPIEAPDRQPLGTLCIYDSQPRTFSSADESLLRQLALRAQTELSSARPARRP